MFTRLFRYENDSQTINIVLKGKSTLFDYTAIEALTSVKHQYNINNKNVNIHGLSHECIKKIAKMNHLCKQIDVDLVKVETPVVPLLYKPLQTILMVLYNFIKFHKIFIFIMRNADIPFFYSFL